VTENSSEKTQTKIDISLLQTFHLVAQTGSFSSAARKLNISYQSAANHVRRLEQMYGTVLVKAEKGSRAVTLTPQGSALHTSLGDELETILARISVLLNDVRSVMRVGVPQALFHHFFPTIIFEFRKQHPDIELSFFERDTILEQMMLSGELDACISERYFGEAGILQMLLGEYHLCLVYPADWDWVVGGQNEIAQFRDQPFITYEPGQTIRSRAQDFLTAELGQAPKIVTTASGCTSVTALVQAGIGYAVVPQWSVGDDDQNTRKIILDQVQAVKVYFGCSAFLEKNPYLSEFQKICLETMGFGRTGE